jgi:hypothetical protein
MHDRLSEILAEEVVGEVRRVGDGFFDVGLGRITLDPLASDRLGELSARLQASYGARVSLEDGIGLEDPRSLVRGLLTATIQPEERGAAPYTLQISSRALFALYEQRFMIERGQLADLMGTLCSGLARLVAEGAEGPLRLLSGLDPLLRKYQEVLDATLRASVEGRAVDVRASVAEMVTPLRAAWKLTPWPLRETVRTVSRPVDRIALHDRELKRTILFASNIVDGKLVYQYLHQHNPLEEYEQVLGWMTEIHQAVVESYPPPVYAAAIARSSSVERFLEHFPGYRAIVGEPLPGGG